MSDWGGRQPDVGGIIGETVSLLQQTLPAALLLGGVIGGFAFAGEMAGLIDPDNLLASLGLGFVGDNTDIGVWLFGILNTVVWVVGSYLYLRSLLAARQVLADGGTHIWAYVGLTILSTLGISLGILALIVPGIVLACRWVAAAGYLISGQEGVTESLGRSFDETRGHGWAIFTAGLVIFGIYFVVAFAIGGALGATGNSAAVAVGSALAEGVGTVLQLAFGIAVYILVHDRAAEVREVFA